MPDKIRSISRANIFLEKMSPHLLILVLIMLIAGFTRLYMLDDIPSGFFSDEATNGYDTYSILKTGRNLQGDFLPLLLNHHNDDYPEPLYTYLSIPFVFLFDLNVFSIRLLAAIIGTLTVLTTYLLTKELFNRKIALLSAFLLAVSPWHLPFSRIALRCILVPFFITLGLFFLFRSLKNPKFLMIAAVVLGLGLYTYSVSKLTIPLLVLLFFSIYFKEFITINLRKFKITINRDKKKYLLISSILFLLLAIPIYYYSFFKGGNLRFYRVSIFRLELSPFLKLFLFLINLFKHIHPDFLFFKGDYNLRHGLPGFGQTLYVLYPFILLALFFFILKKNKEGLFIFSYFIIGIIPASLTFSGIPHALRSIPAVPSLEIIGAYGIFSTLRFFKNNNKHIKVITIILVSLLLVLNSGYFLYSYFVEYPSISEEVFYFGMEESINYAENYSNEYDNIILTNTGIVYPYIFPLFFTKADPSKLHNTGKTGKYIICYGDINVCATNYKGHNLFIVKPHELPYKNIKKIIYNNNNEKVFKIVE